MRNVVLRSSSLKIGDHVEVAMEGIPPSVRIGERIAPVLRLRSDKDLQSLTVESYEGLSLPEDEVHLARTEGDLMGPIALSIEGKEGPSILTVTVITGEVGATAGRVELDLDVRSPRTTLGIPGSPFKWDGEGRFEIAVSLYNPMRVKGELFATLVSPDGEAVTMRTPASSKVSFKGDKIERISFDPLGKGAPGHYDLILRLEADHGVESSFEDAVFVPEKGPHLGIAGASAGSWARTGVSSSGSSPEARLQMDGSVNVMRTRSADGYIEVRIPDEAAGRGRIDILSGGSVIASGDVEIIPRSVLESIAIAVDEATVKAGTETSCRIMFAKRSDTPLEAVLTVGSDGRIKARSDLSGIEGIAEVRFKVPREMSAGVQAAILEVFDGNGSVHRSIEPELFNVVSDVSAEVSLEVPETRSEDEIGAYMYPGETVRSSEAMGRLSVHELSTGRRMMVYDGIVVFGRGWDERKDLEALANYALLMFREALTLQEFRRSLRESVGRFEGLMGSVERSGVDLPPISRSYAEHASGRSSDPLVGRVRSFAKEAMAGKEVSFQDLVEHAASLLKGSARPDMTGSISMALRCARSASSSVNSIGGSKTKDPALIENAIIELVFSSLIQMEIVSAWSDPALSAWDDLRALRQRSIRRSVDSALASVEALASVSKRTRGRFAAYKGNMTARRNLASLRLLKIRGRPTLSTTQSGSLKGSVTLAAGPEGFAMDMFLILPSGSWGVVSPAATRERIGHYIGRADLSSGQTLSIELELSPPQGSKGGSVVLFAKPLKDTLEEEP